MKKQYPLNYISITQDYSSNHLAIDFGWKNNPNVDVLACDDGFVQDIYYFADGGNCLKIKYDDGYSSDFMHLKDNSIIVNKGQKVSKGQKVAIMGSTGKSTGPHLHLIMRNSSGNRINPVNVLYVYPNQEVEESIKNKVLYYEENIERKYVVQKGDTLSSIANKYGTTYQELAKYNNIKNPNLIYPNQIILIPTDETYIVQKGDTLSSIAVKYNTTWQKLYEMNRETIGENPNLIKPGQKLII